MVFGQIFRKLVKKNKIMENLSEKDQKYIWHPFTPYSEVSKVISLQSAKGVYLYTHDGREILDAISSWWVNLHGHSHPYIAQAIFEQAQQLEHVIFAGFTHEPAVRLAQNLMQLIPFQDKVFFSDNGSTACEVALKMAFQYWYNQKISKKKVIAFNGSYHGDTFGAMSVGDRSPFNAPFEPYLFEVSFLDLPEYSQNKEVESEKNRQIVEHFTDLAKKQDVAAFIYEPLVQGASGMRMYSPKILDKLLEIAKKYDIICIADEVMTGFGRTGELFASFHCDHKPDIMCLSKGLTGGSMALGLTTCSQKIFEAYQSNDLMKTFFHGHSFTANPIACRAALASLELLQLPDCQTSIQKIAISHQNFAKKIQNHTRLKNVRTCGVILALEIDTETETSYFNEARSSLYAYFLEKNILLRPLGNVIYVLPPYIITEKQLQSIYESISDLLDNLEN